MQPPATYTHTHKMRIWKFGLASVSSALSSSEYQIAPHTDSHLNHNHRNGRAVGIEYITDSELVTVAALRLVVVSAGALGSPAILERSGIGATPVLNKNNVPVIFDLPGVGENYRGM